MTNDTMVIVFALLTVITGIVLLISIVQKAPRNVRAAFWFLGVCTLCALFSDMVFFSATNPAWIQFFHNLKIPFIMLAAVATFVLVLRFYHRDKILNKGFIAAILIIPAFISVIALTGQCNSLFQTSQTVATVASLNFIDQVHGVGFWIYVGYCYVLLLAALAVAILKHQKLPSGYRVPSALMIISLLVIGASALVNTLFPDIRFDCTLIAMASSYLLMYVAISTSTKTDLLVVARDEIFNYLEELVFILSLDRQVLDANHAALRWMASLNLTANFPLPFARIMGALHEKGVSILENDASGDGIDIYFSHNEYDVMYNLKERFVLDEDERPIGFYITLFDVTRYKTTIDRLEIMAEVDPLTGLPNRRAYDALKARFQEEQPPVSVIIGDVNNLKKVNDELGHHEGDQLLQVVARQLRRSCPKNGTVLRIGGDEFVMFLPETPADEARRVMFAIEQNLRNKTTYPFVPSIALGAATRERADEDIEAVIRHADVDMYHNKNDRRKR